MKMWIGRLLGKWIRAAREKERGLGIALPTAVHENSAGSQPQQPHARFGLLTVMNGKVLDSGSIHLWQQHISAVFYNFHLFPKPYGLVLHSTEYVVELMQELELDLDLLKPDGYFRNLALSAGQRKRLALITALLENRPVLVLDEWAADQDPYFKKKFYTKIVPSLRDRGKTIVAITHDDAYFSVADRVLKMDNGSIKQEVDV